ncbi:hypothetical protein CI102_10334 [Trichoderma harzianum]|uniref:Uncharacterized protein n=1 Tax=Trichoderma harzianum CBS 226.95 TaxID=983964 RepID=A0A2T3ZTN8_TRIHA|nr:hypothetical protein M431DRAFT_487941 [Trichoderma harzianum CBS 226.95]PKK46967.1 hypothetical protein CI102_10334 [Trichoderma harzianum]PTB48157.1 hypothetical protein M431DRAFT_487941 [Trichoderma harzianum CBS 226.95]
MASTQPASQRPPSEAPFRCAHFCSIACFYFSLSLTRTSYRAAGVARSPDLHLPAGGPVTSGASASALFCNPCICVWPSDEPGLLGATLFTSARHSQRQNGGRRIERSHRRDVDVHGAEATRRRSRTVKTTGNIPGNAPSRCWEAHVQHEHAVPVLDLGAQVPHE